MRRPDGATIFLAFVFACAAAGLCYVMFFSNGGQADAQRPRATFLNTPLDSRRCFDYLQTICDIGPRISGTEGMARQQQLLRDHFEKLGGKVSLQQFDVRHPQDGSRVTMGNMIVEWHPERLERILICAHYDTRPFPDQDRKNPRGRFIGANDGGSGVAVMQELAHHIPQAKTRYGIDFVLFDGEELIYDAMRDKYFLGSEYFAQDYVARPPRHRYRCGVLLDMVGDAELQIYQERNSYRSPATKALVDDIWGTARRIGVTDFISRLRHEVLDDHLALNNIAKIPTCDLIDFDYPRPGVASYWHTEADTPDKCSGLSMVKVGTVLLEWMQQVK